MVLKVHSPRLGPIVWHLEKGWWMAVAGYLQRKDHLASQETAERPSLSFCNQLSVKGLEFKGQFPSL